MQTFSLLSFLFTVGLCYSVMKETEYFMRVFVNGRCSNREV